MHSRRLLGRCVDEYTSIAHERAAGSPFGARKEGESMRFAICDDQPADRRLLAGMLEAYARKRELQICLQEFSQGEALLDSLEAGKFQFVFLDIYMPGASGMETARRIREIDTNCFVIFATTSEDHALESYGVYAAGYLLKPYTMPQLEEVMNWCMDNLPPQAQSITILLEREPVQLPLQDITYIESMGREAIFHLGEKTYSTNRRISELEAELPADFVRCHRSYIVNMNHIAKVTPEGFLLKGWHIIPVSADLGASAKQRFFDWMFERTWKGHG